MSVQISNKMSLDDHVTKISLAKSKVKISIFSGLAIFFFKRYPIFEMITLVFPEPAPATITSGPEVCKTASF